jgi:hypothetical protein
MAMGSQWGGDGVRREVTYDSRALVLNGARSSGGARKCRLGIPPKKKIALNVVYESNTTILSIYE